MTARVAKDWVGIQMHKDADDPWAQVSLSKQEKMSKWEKQRNVP